MASLPRLWLQSRNPNNYNTIVITAERGSNPAKEYINMLVLNKPISAFGVQKLCVFCLAL